MNMKAVSLKNRKTPEIVRRDACKLQEEVSLKHILKLLCVQILTVFMRLKMQSNESSWQYDIACFKTMLSSTGSVTKISCLRPDIFL